MNKQSVLSEFTVENGIIKSPGKFEGEPVFVPHFWSLALEGFSDGDDGRVLTFKFQHNETPGQQCAEFNEWPELKTWLGRKRTLRLIENEQGFVHAF
jgi:hypothetical protein